MSAASSYQLYGSHNVSSLTPVPLPSKFPSGERILLGVVLAITGNLLISVAMNVQKYSHMQLEKSDGKYITSKVWWSGLILMVAGEVGNFSAYGFAPASLVAPLGTTTVIANAVIAVMFLKEILRYRDVLGITLAIVGAFLLISFSTKTDTMLTGDEIVVHIRRWTFIVYLVVELLLFLLVSFFNYKYHFGKIITTLLQVAILGSLTVISAKAVSSMLTLTLRGLNQLDEPVLYAMIIVMVLTAVGQVRYLNQAMKSYDTTVVVPTNFVLFTMFAIASGVVFYEEFYGMVFLEIFMFLFGAILSFAGVYFVTGGRKNRFAEANAKQNSSIGAADYIVQPACDTHSPRSTVSGLPNRIQPFEKDIDRTNGLLLAD